MPGGGFEPPTRGFSVRCSTPELPGLTKLIAPLNKLLREHFYSVYSSKLLNSAKLKLIRGNPRDFLGFSRLQPKVSFLFSSVVPDFPI